MYTISSILVFDKIVMNTEISSYSFIKEGHENTAYRPITVEWWEKPGKASLGLCFGTQN